MMKYTFDENIVSDLYKEAYGFRPKEYFWFDWGNASDDGKQEIWDNLLAAANDAAEEEHLAQLEAEKATEEHIQSIMNAVIDCTREDAIRHLHDVYDTDNSTEYLEYCLGVRFGYLSGNINPLYS